MNKQNGENVEVTSASLENRLIRIEDRIAGVEALLAHSNRDQIENLIADAVGKSEARKQILRLCEVPRSIAELQKELGLNSPQAVHNHLGPLKDHGLVQHATTSPTMTYEWAPLIRRLSKAVRAKLLSPGAGK